MGQHGAVRDSPAVGVHLDLYWIPLGAGARVVRISGKVYETVAAALKRRQRCDLYHSALVATMPDACVFIEMAPVFDDRGEPDRGVVAEGAVGSRLLGRFRVFRYEVRRWRDGFIPDLTHAMNPIRVSDDARAIEAVLELVPRVPAVVWGRDELQTGDMWNSNSVISWVLTMAGIEAKAGGPPTNGRAPGWDAGLIVARRQSAAAPEANANDCA